MADFMLFVLKTPYGAWDLTDWILQAKLSVYCAAQRAPVHHILSEHRVTPTLTAGAEYSLK